MRKTIAVALSRPRPIEGLVADGPQTARRRPVPVMCDGNSRWVDVIMENAFFHERLLVLQPPGGRRPFHGAIELRRLWWQALALMC